ncbi:MAG: hypothetical protein WA667_13460, partial [Candidatus Nitrosopolaris sp.]
MIDVTQTLVPFAGSGLAGYAMGFFFKESNQMAPRRVLFWPNTFIIIWIPSTNSIKWEKLGNYISNTTQGWT